MALQEKGRYYQLPVVGAEIKKLVYDGLLRIAFNDQEESYLDLHGEFEITQHNEKCLLPPRSKEALLLFYDLFGIPIKDAKADKFGRLFLSFNNGLEITVEDGLIKTGILQGKTLKIQRTTYLFMEVSGKQYFKYSGFAV